MKQDHRVRLSKTKRESGDGVRRKRAWGCEREMYRYTVREAEYSKENLKT